MIAAEDEGVAVVRAAGGVDVIVLQQDGDIWKRSHDVHKRLDCRADKSAGDEIASKRIADDVALGIEPPSEGIVDGARLAGEVAVALLGDGEGGDGGSTAAETEAFPTGEPESLVAAVVNLRQNDGATDGDAVLILAERNFADALAIGEEIVGVELVVAEELVGGAVNITGTGFGGDVDVGPGGAAELSGGIVEDAELLDGVHGRRGTGGVHHLEVVVDAVDGVVVVLAALAID